MSSWADSWWVHLSKHHKPHKAGHDIVLISSAKVLCDSLSVTLSLTKELHQLILNSAGQKRTLYLNFLRPPNCFFWGYLRVSSTLEENWKEQINTTKYHCTKIV